MYKRQIHTTATSKDGDKTILAGKEVTIVDTVKLDGLTKGTKYQLKGWQMLKEENAELLIDGKRVDNDYTFTADSEKMTVRITYSFDGSALGGQNLVTFEELYDMSNPKEPVKVAEHKDINDDGQTVLITERIIKIHTTATDKNGKKEIRNRHGVNKAEMGHFKKAGVSGKRFVREFRFENASEYNVKDEIKADIFAAGDKIDATAISKGKGFQGAIKRHGQSRGPMAHGSKFHRHQGSNGACSSPSKVFKGKGMPGQMGHVKVTVQNLEVVKVDAENNLLLVKGAVPGPKKSLVTIKETVKAGK